MSEAEAFLRVRAMFADHPDDLYDRAGIIKTAGVKHRTVNYYLTQLMDNGEIERVARGKYRWLGGAGLLRAENPPPNPATTTSPVDLLPKRVSRPTHPKPGKKRRGSKRDTSPARAKRAPGGVVVADALTTKPAPNGKATLTVAPAAHAKFETKLTEKTLDKQAAKIGATVSEAVVAAIPSVEQLRGGRPALVQIEEPLLDDVLLARSFRERVEANPEIFTAIDRAWYDKIVTHFFQGAEK